jgi:dTDP-4-dehydrorhamnose reductase
VAASTDTVDLVIGADGLIGNALFRYLGDTGVPVRGTTRRAETRPGILPLDLARVGPQWRPPAGVGVAYLTAAVAQLSRCEDDPIGTQRVNVDGALRVAGALVASGGCVVFLSTSLVYDGTRSAVPADAPTCPVTVYGKQKALAEPALLALGSAVAIVRITKVVAPRQGVFGAWEQTLARGESIEPFSDMVVAPVSLPFTVAALVAIGRHRQGGIWQLSGPADLSYAEAARHLLRCRGLPEARLRPTTARERGLSPSLVPRHTSLDTSRLEKELGLVPPPAAVVFDELFCAGSREDRGPA